MDQSLLFKKDKTYLKSLIFYLEPLVLSIDQTSLRNSSAFEGQNPRTVLQEIREIFQDNSKKKKIIIHDVLSWTNTFEVISIQKKKYVEELKCITHCQN